MNLSARDDITKAWYGDARIDNVFDQNYELAYQYNTPQYNRRAAKPTSRLAGIRPEPRHGQRD